jgi:hypothetical protein
MHLRGKDLLRFVLLVQINEYVRPNSWISSLVFFGEVESALMRVPGAADFVVRLNLLVRNTNKI